MSVEHMSLIYENRLVSFAVVSLAVSLRKQNKTIKKRTKHTKKQVDKSTYTEPRNLDQTYD